MADLSLEAARRRLDMSVMDLWVRYFGLGGAADAETLAAVLAGPATISDSEHDVIAVALNEAFSDRGQDHPVRYRRPDVRPE